MSVTIREECRGAHHGQVDCTLRAHDEAGALLGYLDYSVFRGVPQIDMVEVRTKRQGVGRALVSYLAKQYGYENVKWGYVTDEGALFRAAMDRELGKKASRLDDVELPSPTLGRGPEYWIEEEGTGGKSTIRLVLWQGERASNQAWSRGHIALGKRTFRRKKYWAVSSIQVESVEQRRRLGTALYEAAAVAACNRGQPLISTGPRTYAAWQFWEKQVAAGAARELRAAKYHPQHRVYIIDCPPGRLARNIHLLGDDRFPMEGIINALIQREGAVSKETVDRLNQMGLEAERLMKEAEEAYEAGEHDRAEEADVRANELLEQLEAAIAEIEEGGTREAVPEDPEDAFARIYHSYMSGKLGGYHSGDAKSRHFVTAEEALVDSLRNALADTLVMDGGQTIRWEDIQNLSDEDLVAGAKQAYEARVKRRRRER